MKSVSKITALAFALAMTLLLVACGGNASGSASSSASDASASGSVASAAADNSSASANSASASSEATSELYGKPWVTSILSGNLPAEKPEVKDDLYTNYNYEYLAAHQGKDASTMDDHKDELQATTTAIVKDESKTGHDLDQLRIFYNQAADSETLQEIGLSEIQPYLDRIEAVKSLDEMNALITAEDFPFSPFITANITVNDTRSTNIVAVNPNFVLCDVLLAGGAYYQDSDDPQTQENMKSVLSVLVSKPLIDLLNAGMSQDEMAAASEQLIGFEKAHGKYIDSSGTYLKADYGEMAKSALGSYFSLDELCGYAPNFPLKATLDKLGKGGSETYVSTKAWLEAFNGLWTEENLDTIKLVAKAKVLGETRPYRDPSYMNSMLAQSEQTASDSDGFAYEACTSIDTLGNVVAKAYVDEALGPNAKPRLTKLSQELVDTYKDLLKNTAWIGEESQQRIIEKLDHMTLNVLEPVCGYFDYSSLELTPTEQGGTLFSNYLKLKKYRQDCESELIGQPAIAAASWFSFSPTTNNAFYEPTSNCINIMPGFVTSLIYTDDMSDADLLANAGFTIGHEISHGFDYMGSQLDAYGTPAPVYAEADVDKFVLKCSTLASYYNGIEIAPGVMVDGELVIGEGAADLCGMQACLELAAKTDGFSYDDYFTSLTSMWAQVATQGSMVQLLVDAHPLSNLRINVNSQMFDAMYERFGVVEGDGMYLAPEERIAIWGQNA